MDIGSVEFGDWINNEMLEMERHSKSQDTHSRVVAQQRNENLFIAKNLLLEFLKIQDEVMQRARSAQY